MGVPYDIMILKSPSVSHSCQHILRIFTKWLPLYQFWFSNKDTLMEILIFLIIGGRFQEYSDRAGEHAETIWNDILKVLLWGS